MRVLLLSGYDAPSHRRWREQLAARYPDWQWTQLSLPPRHFKWRMRGSGFLWAFEQAHCLREPYDLLIATSMVDLSALRGLVPEVARIPTLVYFHENQFAYPQRKQQRANVEPQLINLYTALCADQVAFNSDYNRQTFLTGVADLLARLPDRAPDTVLAQLHARSRVLPIPIERNCFVPDRAPEDGPLTLIWNHRWEYDKAPDRLLNGLRRFFELCPAGKAGEPAIRVHVVGQQFRQQPPAFDALKSLLDAHDARGAWGYVESREAYGRLLAESHAVLSTALHDFQGLSVLEAVAAGCRPLVPDREAYPEWFAPDYRYLSDPENPELEAQAFAERLLSWRRARAQGEWLAVPDIDFLHERQWHPVYRDELIALAQTSKI